MAILFTVACSVGVAYLFYSSIPVRKKKAKGAIHFNIFWN